MSYICRKLKRNIAQNHDELVNILINEIRLGSKGTGPKIIEEQVYNSIGIHVYVIWDGWKDIDGDHRFSAILDAYENYFGKRIIKNILVALGLTEKEAKEYHSFLEIE